jgi:hypothetical protein
MMGGGGEHVPSVESWRDADQRIEVSSRPGFLWNVLLRARINASPDEVYSILTDEHPERIFRGIKVGFRNTEPPPWPAQPIHPALRQAVVNRRVVQEDKRTGKRTLELTHRAFTKFLFITVTFDTHLFVDEDPKHRTVGWLADSGPLVLLHGILLTPLRRFTSAPPGKGS